MGTVPARIRRKFPELELFDDPASELRAWKLAHSETIQRRRTSWKLIFGFLLAIFALMAVTSRFVHPVAFGILVGLGILAWYYFGAIHFFRREIAQSLRHQLRDAQVPICMRCGYCLRGVAVDTCPECGKPAAVESPRTNPTG